MYEYKKSVDDVVESLGVWEDSSEELTFYRSFYNALIHQYGLQQVRGTSRTWPVSRWSQITWLLQIEIQDTRWASEKIKGKILKVLDNYSLWLYYPALRSNSRWSNAKLLNIGFETFLNEENLFILARDFASLLCISYCLVLSIFFLCSFCTNDCLQYSMCVRICAGK